MPSSEKDLRWEVEQSLGVPVRRGFVEFEGLGFRVLGVRILSFGA